MTFIPNGDELKVGDRVELTQPIKILSGTFTAGHQFTVTYAGSRGIDIIDDDGREVGECGLIQHTFRKIILTDE